MLFGGLAGGVLAFPDAAIASGSFQPVPHARGVPQGKIFPKAAGQGGTPSSKKEELVVAAESARAPVFGSGGHLGGGGGGVGHLGGGGGGVSHLRGGGGGIGHFGGGGGGLVDPTKTIYVNVPQEEYPSPEPIAAGPPRKHYRIVFIRSPVPPQPQPILPPRVEQKTLIYVLHPRQTQQQSVVEVPDVKHDPQVYFIQYENEPPSAQELQDLVQNTIGGSGETNINYGSSSLIDGPPSSSGSLSLPPQPVYAASSSIENSLAPPYQTNSPPSSQVQPGKVTQSFTQKLSRPELLKAHANLRDAQKISHGFQQFQQFQQPQLRPKFLHTRAASHEGPKEESTVGAALRRTPLRSQSPVFRPKENQQTQEAVLNRHSQKKASLDNPSDRKAPPRGNFRTRPFRFGSKLNRTPQQVTKQQPSKENVEITST